MGTLDEELRQEYWVLYMKNYVKNNGHFTWRTTSRIKGTLHEELRQE